MTDLTLNKPPRTLPIYCLGCLLVACGGHRTVDIDAPPESERVPPKAPEVSRRTETEWLAILLDGHKAGYVKSRRDLDGDRVITEVTTAMELRRGMETIEILSVSTMTETADGAPLSFKKVTGGAGMHQEISGEITPEGELRVSTEAAGHFSTRTMPWPVGTLMNEGQRLETLRHGLEEGVAYTSRYFDPDLLEPLEVEVRVGAAGPLDLFGRVVTVHEVRLKMVIRGNPAELVMYVDDEINTLKTASQMMGMTVEMIACTEQYALSDNDVLELIRATFVKSPKPLTARRRQKPLTYTLRLSDEDGSLDIPTTGEQTVTAGVPSEVTVSSRTPPPGGEMPYRGDDAEARLALEPNRWIQSDAEEIRSLAVTAIRGATDPKTAALNIEQFVADYILEKNFSVGYASALEVARSREGDCTEHALLTAALCRAAGIPAKVVAGLVYVDRFEDETDLFGGHAWTTVYLNGEWVSLDATNGFDTGHLALAVSDGAPAAFFKIINIIGSLEIVAIE